LYESVNKVKNLHSVSSTASAKTILFIIAAIKKAKPMNLKRYFIKKTVSGIQAEAGRSTLKRTLGKWNLLSLGIGCIIGAGIFVMTGQAAADHAGPAIVLSFILAGIACAFAGLCYAEMASILPISGSAYTYAYTSLGEVLAWVMGWLLILEYGLASATVSVGWSGYLVSFLTDFGIHIPAQFTQAYGQIVTLVNDKVVSLPNDSIVTFLDGTKMTLMEALKNFPVPEGAVIAKPDGTVVDATFVKALFNVPAALGIVMVTSLLIIGISESAKVNNFIVFVKVAVILAFIAIGAFFVDMQNWQPFIPDQLMSQAGEPIAGAFGYDGVLRAASIIFFAYIGFESISTAAQEAKDPQKDMPFAIIGALVLCTVLYILVSGVLTGIVDYRELGVDAPMAYAADQIGLGWFKFLIKVGAIMGLSSVMLVLVYGQTRIFYIMSSDGLLPKMFHTVHKKFQTPHLNTMFVGFFIAIAAGLMPLKSLGDMVSLGTMSAFMIVCFSVLYLRYSQPEVERPFRTPFVPFVPLAGMGTSGYLIYGMASSEGGAHTLFLVSLFLMVGLFFYLIYGQFNSKLKKEHDAGNLGVQ